MKTLLIAPQPYYSNRGTPMNTRLMLSVLTEAGIPVDLLTYPGGEDTPMPGLTIHRVGRPPGIRRVPIGPSPAKLALDALLVPAALRLARRGRYRLVHAIEESVYLGIVLRRMHKMPLIYDMDSSMKDQLIDYGWARGRLLQKMVTGMENLAVRRCDLVITVCAALTAIVRGIDPAKPVVQIEDIPLEVPCAAIPPDARDLERRFAGREVLLYTGNFEPYQGVDLLVDALPEILQRRPGALLVLVGGSGEPRKRIERRLADLGSGGNAILLDPRPPAEMGWFMERASVLLSPRLTGTNTPLKLYTYLGSGRPVVATRALTHTQVLDDARAVLVEPVPGAMAAGIAGLLADPAVAARIGRAGRELVEEKYSRARFREKLLGAYAQAGGYRFDADGRVTGVSAGERP